MAESDAGAQGQNEPKRGGSAELIVFGALPVAALAALIILLQVFLSGTPQWHKVYEPFLVFSILNTLFIFCASGAVALVALRSYLTTGSPAVLFLGCGVLAMGLGSFFAGWLNRPLGSNVTVTIHNTSTLLAALLHGAAALSDVKGNPPVEDPERRGRNLVYGYLGVAIFVSVLTLATIRGFMPPFFTSQGHTGTRQAVLSVSLLFFATTSAYFLCRFVILKARFLYWYGIALAAISVSLLGILLQPTVGSLIGWLARIVQYAAGVYFLAGVLSMARAAHARGISLNFSLAESFRRSEQKISTILDSITDCHVEIDRHLRFTRVNEQCLAYFGRRREEFIGRHYADVLPEARESVFETQFLKVIREGSDVHFDARSVVIPDKWVEVHVYPTDEGLSVFFRDVTEQRQAETALKDRGERLKILSEVAERLLRSEKPQEVVEELCRKVMDYLDCHVFFNFLVDEEAGRLKLNACAGIPPETAEEIRWLDFGVAVCGAVALEAHRIVAEDIPGTSNPKTDLVKGFGVKAYACHPLFSQGKVIGTLSFGTKSRLFFASDDLAMMKAVADQVAIAIERMRTVEDLKAARDELEARVEERTAELRRARDELVEQGRILEGFFDSTITPLVFLDRDFNFVRVNEAYARCCGKEIGGFQGRNHFALYPNAENEAIFRRVVEARAAYQATAKPFSFPDHPEWGVTYWDWTLTPLVDRAGEVEYLVFSLRDVTDQIMAEQAATRAGEYNRSLIEASLDPLVTIDPDGKISDVNSATEEVTGFARAELVGTDFSDYFTEPERAKAGYLQVFSEGMVRDYPLEIRHRNGHTTPVLYNASVYYDDEGRIIGIFAAARDVSDLRRAEEQLRQAQKMEAIGTLAGGIAHDFNNILASILGFTEMALEDVPDRPHVEKSLKYVLKSAMRARELVQQILAFSRKAEHERNPLSLTPLIKETIQLLRASIPTTVSIEARITASPDVIVAAPVEVQQILMNLVTNAALAMKETGGTVEVGLMDGDLRPDGSLYSPDGPEGEYLELWVRDSGEGMAPEVMKRIFEPFFTTREVGKGSGMGLAVAYGIVKSLRGTITVESEKGKGSIFRVRLPRALKEAPGEQRHSPSPPGGKERILFVDDEDILAELNRERLKGLGYEVTESTSGVEALDIFRANPDAFDLVITDYTMPRMTGLEFALEVLKLRRDMPIILCTGFTDAVSPDQAKAAGIREFLMKPLSKAEMAEAVHRVLRGGPQA